MKSLNPDPIRIRFRIRIHNPGLFKSGSKTGCGKNLP
jgi:hypothetical protein